VYISLVYFDISKKRFTVKQDILQLWWHC